MTSKREVAGQPGARGPSEQEAAGWQRRFGEQFGEQLQPGEALPDLGLVATLIGRQLAGAARGAPEAGTPGAPRQERDRAAQHVHRTLVDLRAVVEAALGPTALTLLDIEHETPGEPAALLVEGREVRRKLRDTSLTLPTARRRGTGFDPAEFAAELEVHLEPLERSLDTIAQEVREGRPVEPDPTTVHAHDPARVARWLAATRALLG